MSKKGSQPVGNNIQELLFFLEKFSLKREGHVLSIGDLNFALNYGVDTNVSMQVPLARAKLRGAEFLLLVENSDLTEFRVLPAGRKNGKNAL